MEISSVVKAGKYSIKNALPRSIILIKLNGTVRYFEEKFKAWNILAH